MIYLNQVLTIQFSNSKETIPILLETMAERKTLHIGVMMEEVQYSDIVPADIFGNLSTQYAEQIAPLFPAHLAQVFISLSTPIVFHYLSSTKSLARMTPSIYYQPTETYDEAPRDLDVLIIGGPMVGFDPPGADKFLKEQKSKIIMTICTGALWLASAGCLKGKMATTNRGVLPLAKEKYPDTEWFDQRWVVDENIWTSGGAGAGKLSFSSKSQVVHGR
jgi:hypothetical protein